MMMKKNEKDHVDMKKRQENEKHHFRRRLVGSVVLTMLIVAMVTGFHHNHHQGSSSSPGHKSHLVSKKDHRDVSGESKLPRGVGADIFGGVTVLNAAVAYPYMVMIYDKRTRQDNGPFCGGTLIKWDLVLTAAHCLQKFDNTAGYEAPANLRVYAGLEAVQFPDWGRNYEYRDVVFVVKHYNYTWNGREWNDIALMKLESDFPHTKPRYIALAPLAPASTGYPAPNALIKIMGTGAYGAEASGTKRYPGHLKTGNNLVLDYASCVTSFPDAQRGKEFCFWDDASKYGICGGDSGSPIVDRVTNKVVGITVQGSGSCRRASVGAGVFIPAFAQWIRTTRLAIEANTCAGGQRLWLRYD